VGEVPLLRYPNKSHRKLVLLPNYSVKLAEFFGLMMGDGGINNAWQVTITLNSIKDKQYISYVSNLCQDLFGVIPMIRKRKNKQATVICLSSITVVNFLVSQGLIRGNKLLGGLKIPRWILTEKSYRIASVKGLIDTDGCLFIHKHTIAGKKYENIGLCFTNNSPDLIEQVATILKENDITPHIHKRGTNVYLYKAEAVIKYMEIFNTSNDRISSVFKTWRDA
jgi:hypothetical protein